MSTTKGSKRESRRSAASNHAIKRVPVAGRATWVSWSHTGDYLAYGDGQSDSIIIIDSKTVAEVAVLSTPKTEEEPFPYLLHAEWSPDDRLIAASAIDGIHVWEWRSGVLERSLSAPLDILAWHPTRPLLIALDTHDGEVWQTETWQSIRFKIDQNGLDYTTAAWGGSKLYVSPFTTGPLLVIDLRDMTAPITHHGSEQTQVAISASIHGFLAYAQRDNTIAIEDTLGTIVRLEHHSTPLHSLSFSHDGRMLASRDDAGTMVVWRTTDWSIVAMLKCSSHRFFYSTAFSPTTNTIAFVNAEGTAIDLWDLNDLESRSTTTSVHYTTAKIALVGDSGVGKTGLGWVLTHDTGFKEHASTHGEQFWIAGRLSKTRSDGAICDAVVWDLAGQPDYRLIHSLFIGDADVALVVFDPTNRQEPLKGAEFWLRALGASKDKMCDVILVGARIDRGTGILTSDEIDAFARTHGVAGGYIATSAMRGDGIGELTARVAELIGWEKRQATVTLEIFKEIRDHVLEIKARESSDVLVTLEQLRGHLHANTSKVYELADIDTATKHLSHHGYLRPLRDSAGQSFILLAPDLLNNLAASMVLEARRNPKGLGALDEKRVLSGQYSFQELAELESRDREVLLDAATTLFIEHNICFRETLGNDPYLIFPSLINQNKPPVEDVVVVDGTAYTATGATENVYASLVVLLGYTNTFTRTNQWRNQARYEMGRGQICGFRLAEERQGEIDLVLYFGADAAASTKQLYQGLFEKFLLARDVHVEIFPPMQCPKCKYAQPRSEVIKRQREQATAMFCTNCGKKVALPERILTAPTRTAPLDAVSREQRTASRRTQFEKAITWLKGYLRDTKRSKSPSCFISYAWGDPDQERWLERHLATDLRNAGISVILDRWHSQAGGNLARFVEQIESADFVALVGTSRLRDKYNSKDTDPVVAAEMKLINARLMQRESESKRVIPLLLEGESRTSLPPLAKTSVAIDFRNEELYFERTFDLLLTLYEIPFDDPAMRDLRDTIRSASKRRPA